MEVVERVLHRGDRAGLARLIRGIDDGVPEALDAVKALYRHTRGVTCVGITGGAGAGKSTIADRLIAAYRDRGLSVGVLAIDPSSPFTGGALLGDRLRMQHHGLDEGVFIRSLASRGHSGGLSPSAMAAAWVLDAAGFEVILVETVGVGQNEVEIASLASTTLLVTTPEAGDQVQALKAGVLEAADVVVVNKADRPGAASAARDLEGVLECRGGQGSSDWVPPVVPTAATTKEGLPDLVQAIDEHEAWLAETPAGCSRVAARWQEAIFCVLTERLRERVLLTHREQLTQSVRRVADRESDPFSEAELLLRLTLAPEK